MRLRKFIFTALLCLGGVSAYAQNMSVESFRLLSNDLTANTPGTMVRDQNGDVSALIKVVTTETGFVFDGGMLGIVDTQQKTGEVWVYVPFGLQRISISHSQLGVLRDYYFPVPIEKARTYEMVLTTGVVRTIVDDSKTMQHLVLNIKPDYATVYIDDVLRVNRSGNVTELLPFGKHTYRVEAAGYISQSGAVEIKDKVELNIELESAQGTLTLNSPMENAEIWLDGHKVGVGTWTGKADPGNHRAEVRLPGYRTRSMDIVLEEQEERAFSLPAPQPMYGSLQINSQPIGAQVLVDSVQAGVTPLYLTDQLAKSHQIIVRMEGYQEQVDTIVIEENERYDMNVTLSNIFTATIKSQPNGATINIDGTDLGTTPYSGSMSTGDYHIVLTHKGYDTFDRMVHVSVEKPTLTLRMDKHCLTPTNFYVAPEYQALGFGAVGIAAGAYLSGLHAEAYFDLGIGQTEKVYWSTQATTGAIEKPMLYEYKVSAAMGGKIGYGIRMGTQIRITPDAGFRVVSVQGISKTYGNQKTYMAQATAGVRLEYSPFNHFAVVVAPEYYTTVKMGETATLLKDSGYEGMKSWFGGVAVKAGLEIYF